MARTALALGRRALSIETSPLTRLLADVVVRPPDLRHLDAAFQAVGAAPLGTSSLRAWIDERFATRCPTCGRTLAAEELVWERPPGGRRRRCPPGARSAARPASTAAGGATSCTRRPRRRRTSTWPARSRSTRSVREEIGGGSPCSAPGAESLPDAILDLHSERQLGGLHAILARIDGDLRASQVTSALRLAFLHAIFPRRA